MSNYEQSNVGMGMAPCKKGCRCNKCEIERLTAENKRLRSELEGAIYRKRYLRNKLGGDYMRDPGSG